MNTETTSNSTCVVLVLSFLHKGDSKYTGSCDLNHMIFFDKKSFDLNHD